MRTARTTDASDASSFHNVCFSAERPRRPGNNRVTKDIIIAFASRRRPLHRSRTEAVKKLT
jgi:hypothetical protein